jgi:hypothetical protein
MARLQLDQGFATGGMRFKVTLQSSNSEPLMSPSGHERRFERCGRMSAFTRRIQPVDATFFPSNLAV